MRQYLGVPECYDLGDVCFRLSYFRMVMRIDKIHPFDHLILQGRFRPLQRHGGSRNLWRHCEEGREWGGEQDGGDDDADSDDDDTGYVEDGNELLAW